MSARNRVYTNRIIFIFKLCNCDLLKSNVRLYIIYPIYSKTWIYFPYCVSAYLRKFKFRLRDFSRVYFIEKMCSSILRRACMSEKSYNMQSCKKKAVSFGIDLTSIILCCCCCMLMLCLREYIRIISERAAKNKKSWLKFRSRISSVCLSTHLSQREKCKCRSGWFTADPLKIVIHANYRIIKQLYNYIADAEKRVSDRN